MVGAMTLSRALAAGGAVIWEPPDKPRLRVAPTFAESLRREADGVREVLRRAAVFKAQLDAEAGGPVVPYFLSLRDRRRPHDRAACLLPMP